MCGSAVSPDDRWLAVSVRLFLGIESAFAFFDRNAPQTKERLQSESETRLAFHLRILLTKTSHFTPSFAEKLSRILRELTEELKKGSESGNPPSERDLNRSVQQWLLLQYRDWLSHQTSIPLNPNIHVFLIDLHSLRPAACFLGPKDIDSMALENQFLIWPSFSPDSRYLYVGSGNGSACVFDCQPLAETRQSFEIPDQISFATLMSTESPLHFNPTPSPSFSSFRFPMFPSVSPPSLDRKDKLPTLLPCSILKGHNALVNMVSHHPRSCFSVSVSDDRSICLWLKISEDHIK